MSYFVPSKIAENVPSCGLRRSEMSMSETTLNAEITPLPSPIGIVELFCSTPSTRKRTMYSFSCGSKWMSVAPAFMAAIIISCRWRTFSDRLPESSPSSVCARAALPSFLRSLKFGSSFFSSFFLLSTFISAPRAAFSRSANVFDGTLGLSAASLAAASFF